MKNSLLLSFVLLSIYIMVIFSTSKVLGAEVIIESSDLEEKDHFGHSVSISGDYAIIGATFENSRYGAAYIFERSGSTWDQVTKLTRSDYTDQGQFGYSVAIDGNYAVVGAPRADSDTGAVYVFHKDTGGVDNWGQVVKITASDGLPDDDFGVAVDIDGAIMIIGAADEVNFGTPGYAYIFTRSGSLWSEQVKLFASDSATGDQFGKSVAIDGDYVVVGAYNNDTTGIGGPAGAAYIFYRNAGGTDNWGEQAFILPNIGGTSRMGNSVDIEGDRVVIGSHEEPSGQEFPYIPENTGAVYIYTRSASVWSLEQKLTASDADANDWFGYSVAISGDYILAGAVQADSAGVADSSGSIYAFLYSGSTWTEASTTFPSIQSTYAQFGFDVDIDGDYSIVGMPQEVFAADSGKAFIYESINDLSLPVYLSAFNASLNISGVQLYWKTESEIENQGFIIERADNQFGQYNEISSYKNNTDLIGHFNSSIGAEYSFIDRSIEFDKKYWYKLIDVNTAGILNEHPPIQISTTSQFISSYKLNDAYPNPFNPKTTISFDIPESEIIQNEVSLKIYNSRGQKVKTLATGIMNTGKYVIEWNGTADNGANVASGVYFLVMDWQTNYVTKKLILMK